MNVTGAAIMNELLLIGLVFLAIGIILSIIGYITWNKARVSTSWPAVPGRILNASVDRVRERNRDSDGDVSIETKYEVDVSYEYTVEGREYVGDTIQFGLSDRMSNSARAYSIVNQYPQGTEVDVYVDPSQPSTSVLQPGVQLSTFLMPAFGLVFAIVGMIMLIAAN
jgi:hypothetical protein